MNDRARQLLGGYATETLTAEEREELFEAALHDQELFAALHDEEALRVLLEQPAARARLLEATETPEFTIAGGLREWWDRPKGKVLATLLAVTLVMVSVKTWRERPAAVERSAGQRSVAVGTVPRAQQAPARPQQSIAHLPEQKQDQRASQATPPTPAAPASTIEAPVPAATPTAAAPAAQSLPPAMTAPVESAGIDWIVERRSADGTWSRVAPDTRFEATDLVRVQVRSSREGVLTIAADQVVTTRPVQAGELVALPRQLTFVDSSEHRLAAWLGSGGGPGMRNPFRQSDQQQPGSLVSSETIAQSQITLRKR
ncbi:MAG TPA: hypothetical protein VES20_00690 [Bryobacteraceae bacterium]|nr:hypothetical protein [Bryobacteraceae bacterium]